MMKEFLAGVLIVLILALLFGTKFRIVTQHNSAAPDTLQVWVLSPQDRR